MNKEMVLDIIGDHPYMIKNGLPYVYINRCILHIYKRLNASDGIYLNGVNEFWKNEISEKINKSLEYFGDNSLVGYYCIGKFTSEADLKWLFRNRNCLDNEYNVIFSIFMIEPERFIASDNHLVKIRKHKSKIERPFYLSKDAVDVLYMVYKQFNKWDEKMGEISIKRKHIRAYALEHELFSIFYSPKTEIYPKVDFIIPPIVDYKLRITFNPMKIRKEITKSNKLVENMKTLRFDIRNKKVSLARYDNSGKIFFERYVDDIKVEKDQLTRQGNLLATMNLDYKKKTSLYISPSLFLKTHTNTFWVNPKDYQKLVYFFE